MDGMSLWSFAVGLATGWLIPFGMIISFAVLGGSAATRNNDFLAVSMIALIFTVLWYWEFFNIYEYVIHNPLTALMYFIGYIVAGVFTSGFVYAHDLSKWNNRQFKPAIAEYGLDSDQARDAFEYKPSVWKKRDHYGRRIVWWPLFFTDWVLTDLLCNLLSHLGTAIIWLASWFFSLIEYMILGKVQAPPPKRDDNTA